jgi:hypothetical protein
MRKNIEDYQGCQYRIIAENRDISVGRRFKPDLGHQRIGVSPPPGGFERCRDPPAHPVGGGHEVCGLDANVSCQ